MAQPPPSVRYYAIPHEDYHRVCAVVDGCAPPLHAMPINHEEADALSADLARRTASGLQSETGDGSQIETLIMAVAIMSKRVQDVEEAISQHAENFRSIRDAT